MEVGKATFRITLDRDLFKRQLAQTAREAQATAKTSGKGYGNAYVSSMGISQGIDKNLRATVPISERQGRAAGARYGDSFSRSAKPKVNVDVNFSEAERKGSAFASSLQGKFGGLGASFTGIMAGASAAVASSLISVVGGAISSVTNGIKSAVGEVYRIGAAAEATKVSLTAVIGDAKQAATVIDSIKKLSAATPFTSGELVGGAKGLLASGTAVSEIATKIKQIGNAAALAKKEGQSLGDSFNNVVQIVSKIQSVGKLTGETMAQLTERNINLNDELAKVLGVQTTEVADLISKGQVSKEVFEEAFTAFTTGGGKATGQMDALAKTTEGLWSTFQEGVETSAVAIFEEVQPALNEVINQLTTSIAKTGENSTAMESLGKIADRFTEYLKQNPEVIQEIVQAISDFVDNQMAALVLQAEKFFDWLEKNPQAIDQMIAGIKSFGDNLVKTTENATGLLKIFLQINEALTLAQQAGAWLDEQGAKIGIRSPIGALMDAQGGGSGGGSVDAGKFTVYAQGNPIRNSNQLTPHHDYQTNGTNEVRDIVLAKGNNQNIETPSPVSGTVDRVDYQAGGAGNYVVLRDEKGFTATLMHFAKVLVKAGDKIQYGQPVGIQGTTGDSSGVHTHIEAPPEIIDKWVNDVINGTWGATSNVNGTGGGRPTASSNGVTPYEKGFLAALRFGESDVNGKRKNDAVGVMTPAGKGRGAYQFMPGTRDGVMRENKGKFDPWAMNDAQQDGAALTLIDMYGREQGKDIRGMINKGDYAGASRILGKNQWTSLPGGAESSPRWRTKSINDFKPKGNSTRQATAQAAGIQTPKVTASVVDKAKTAADAKKKANDLLYVANKKKDDAEAKKRAEQAAKEAAEAQKQLYDEVAKGISDSNETIRKAQSEISNTSDPNRAKLDSEIQSIKDKYKGINEDFQEQIQGQRKLLEKAQDPQQRKQIEGNIKSIDALLSASKKQEAGEIKTRELALMMENTAKAEAELAEARAKRLEDERAYTEALFNYLAENKAKGETIKNAIKVNQENTYQSKKNQALNMASLLSSDASVLSAKAAGMSDINGKAALNREAGLLNIQAETTQQLSAIDDLARSGQFADSQIQKLRDNVMALSQMKIDGLKTEFLDLGGIIGQELQSSFGNFLSAILTGSQTASEALQGLVNQLLSALANLAIKSLLGGLFPGSGGLLGFASGTGLGTVGDAFSKERKESMGRQPLLAVLNQDEMVLNPKQARQYKEMMSGGIMSFSTGSMPLMPTMSQGIGGGTNQITQNISLPSGTSKQDSAKLAKELEQAVMAVLVKQKTTAGGLLR